MRNGLHYGSGRPYRERGIIERAAALAGGTVPAGPVRAGFARLMELALWAGTGGRGLRATLPHGELVRLAPRYRRMMWNNEEYEAFRAATRPGDVVVDAGANTGAYTVLFAQWVGPAGHVYAFEPVPVLARALRAQVTLNGVADRVTVVEAALGDRAGTVAMSAPGITGINRRLAAGDPAVGSVTAMVERLDDFLARHGAVPRVVKIDVEGAELDVIRGGRNSLGAFPRPRVFVELHPSLWPLYGVTATDLQHELRELQLRVEPLRSGDDPWKVEGICARLVPE